MNHNPDILEKMQELAFRISPDSEIGRLLCDAADEIYRLRALITEWYEAECAELRNFPPGLEAMTRASKAREALFKETNL